MGLILIPFLFAAFLIFVRAVWQFYPLVVNQTFSIPGILLGIVIPLVLIKITRLMWIKEGNIYAFTPMFRYPILMIFMPFIIGTVLFRFDLSFEMTAIVKSTLLSWTVFSGLIIVPIMSNVTEWLKKNGVKYHY